MLKFEDRRFANILNITMKFGNPHVYRKCQFTINTEKTAYGDIGNIIENRYGAQLLFGVPESS